MAIADNEVVAIQEVVAIGWDSKRRNPALGREQAQGRGDKEDRGEYDHEQNLRAISRSEDLARPHRSVPERIQPNNGPQANCYEQNSRDRQSDPQRPHKAVPFGASILAEHIIA